MTSKEDRLAEKILSDVTRTFVRSGKVKPEASWDCLVCGRRTVQARRIHLECRRKDPAAARTAENRFFRK